MTKGRALAAVTVVVVGLVALGASTHAAAGEIHEAADCLACTLCDWLNGLFT